MSALVGVIGALIVLGTFSSVLRTLLVPRASRSVLTRMLHKMVQIPLQFLADRCGSIEARERVLAPMAALSVLFHLVGWLAAAWLGYSMLQIAVSGFGVADAFRETAVALFTLGFASSRYVELTVLDVLAAATGPIVIGLQIGYLPALYSAYSRREEEVTMLQARAGSPPWGPEILARCAQIGLTGSAGDLFRSWERWSAQVGESHTSYVVLSRFRSPRSTDNWLISLLAVMDAAAIQLALNPSMPQGDARLVLRAGFVCLRNIAGVWRLPFDPDPSPDTPIQLTYEEFAGAVAHITAHGYPVERTAEQAWPHFCGWRVNYEDLAYSFARLLDAVPAPWSGPRRTHTKRIAPVTPVDRTPDAPR
ncbi:hypothetical protein ACFU6R_18410 [Streptomyces sp. NPDC057499]|uniref:hypothetical protein n=1 Tax=Streptomyces sp. NPDC057499 TaxID=3346150 RepID=UPI0036CE73DB